MKRNPLIEIAALATVYALTARAALTLDTVSGFATLVWPATGLSLAALSVRGLRLWPGVFVGALVANVWAGAPWYAALGIAAGNTLEALVGAWALRRLPGFRPSLDRVADAVTLIAVCAFCSTLLSATVGTTSLWLAGRIGEGQLSATWSAWWVGDVLSALVVAPLLMTWTRRTPARVDARRTGEAVLLALCIGLLAALVFGRPTGSPDRWQGPYFFFPLLIWGAVRFGVRGAATATFGLSALAIWGTARGGGPFVEPSLHEALLALQVFIAVCAATFLVLGAASSERRRALEDRERLVSIASHELRTPLAALSLSLYRKKKAAASPSEASSVAVLERQTDRLGRIVDGLLEVSRLNAGRLSLELSDVDLVEVARATVSELADEARASGSEVTLSAPPELRGQWDRLRLEQVVANLLSNALRYGAGKPIELRLSADATNARIDVVDQGIGVPKEDQERIFQPFEQSMTPAHVGGFGLGLWIVRQIVDALGGSVTLTSAPGRGSTFTVLLPKRQLLAGRSSTS